MENLMNRSVKTLCVTVCSVTLITAGGASAEDFYNSPDPRNDVYGSVPFQEYTPEIAWASLWGNDEGQHGGITRFAPGYVTSEHTHTHPYHAVVLKGTIINPFEDGESVEMGPGSYWYVPANMVHTTGCVSEEPCEFYYHADYTDDYIEVE